MKKTILTLVLTFVSVLYMHAQETAVKGQVIDADSTDPVAGVTVAIKGSELTQTTDELGSFNFTNNLPLGEQSLIISKEGYFTKVFTIIIEEAEVVDLSTIILKHDLGVTTDFTISLSEDELDEDESVASNTSGILQSSRDVFDRAAAFDFSGTFFRVRGLDSENGTMLLNGIRMNKMYNGRPQWSNWGGINDVMRNQDFVRGSKANEYAFGGVGGTTNINMRASQARKGTRISYASSNRSYNNRIMATHATGLMENGWALTITAGRRWAEEAYQDGTVYDANSMFASVEKKINDKHSINFTSIYTPNRRGKAAAITEEVLNLKGRKYNPYWGYQDGEIRNSRIREIEEPILMLNHYWTISDKTTLNTNVSYQFGHIGNSRIDFNASNPDPTYYKKLPSYYLSNPDFTDEAEAYRRLQEFLNDGQIDWNQLYQDNITANQPNPNTPDYTDVYVLYEDRNDDKQWSFNSILNTELNDNISLNAAVNYSTLKSENYAKVLDLLGGNGYLDVDYFSLGNVSDDPNVPEINPNSNVLTPDRIVTKGDKFKYNYNLYAVTYDGFAQAQFRYNKVDFYLGGQYGKTTYQREGLYENGIFRGDASYGKGEKLEFDKFGAKAGLTYKISGKHLLDFNGAYIQDAPTMRNTFANSRINHLISQGVTEQKTTAFDASYIFRSSILKTRLTGFYSTIEDTNEVGFYYIDGLSQGGETQDFVSEVVTGIDKRNLGVELGVEAQVTPTIKLKAAGSVAQAVYANNPQVYLNTDLGELDLGIASMKDYKVAGGPQTAYSVGFEYRDPKYWWVGASANFFANSYLDVAPVLRTSNFTLNTDTGVMVDDYDENIAKELLKQEEFDNYMLVNLVGGKSWKVGDKYIGFFASINNVFNELYKTGGYEQSRNGNYTNLLEDSQRENRLFGPKYWFGRGTTYYMNVYLRF